MTQRKESQDPQQKMFHRYGGVEEYKRLNPKMRAKFAKDWDVYRKGAEYESLKKRLSDVRNYDFVNEGSADYRIYREGSPDVVTYYDRKLKQRVTHPSEQRDDLSYRQDMRAQRGTYGTSLRDMEVLGDSYLGNAKEIEHLKDMGFLDDDSASSLLRERMFKGSGVKMHQRRLSRLGYDLGKGGADGTWGPDTHEAFEQYREDWNFGLNEEQMKKNNKFKNDVNSQSKPKAKPPKVEDRLINLWK